MGRARTRGTEDDSDVDRSPDAAPASGPTRRRFLRGALAGAVVVAGGMVWRADDQGVFAPFEGPAFEAWRSSGESGTGALAAATVLAASAHNMQNWLLHLTGSRADLFDDPRRSLGAVDPFRREAHLGLGCALANLELACPPSGLSGQTTLVPSATEPELVATIALTQADARDDDPLFHAIRSRHCDRGPYPEEAPGQELLDHLARTASAGSEGVEVRWLTGGHQLDEAGALLVDAAEIVVADEAMSRDGFAWFRTTPDEVRRQMDGLTLDCQALPALTELAAKMLPPVSRQRGDATWVQMTREVHTATARAYGLVLAPRTDVAARLRAGCALQRLHLALTSEGWAMQHLNQAVEVAEREEATGRSPNIADRLSSLADGAEVIAMVRVGRPSGRAARSPRRPHPLVLV
ncbi:hypothetical protein [Cellulomonas sp. KRMCY2]|uniref:hypothetical protein n=1 Tax=Cellulomonas sp. KRMCY2 TaxID=1304865 RepID=UPI00045E959D|nr:hypothetical protein [Cellulomonas sp. KRMCY2]